MVTAVPLELPNARLDAEVNEGLAGVEEAHHVASPIPPAQPEDPDELIVPAREGTLRVLRAAREAGVRRVVLTSSFAAVGYSPKAIRDYTEDDWTDPDTPGLPPYPRSKAIAERAAWDYIGQHPGDIELVVLNPTFIIGPALVTALRSSLVAIKAIAEGTMPALPRQRFGVADVRDVADAHLKAAATPDAVGKRYLLLADGPTITWLGLAEAIRDHLGAAGANVTLREAPGEDPSLLKARVMTTRRRYGLARRSGCRPSHAAALSRVTCQARAGSRGIGPGGTRYGNPHAGGRREPGGTSAAGLTPGGAPPPAEV